MRKENKSIYIDIVFFAKKKSDRRNFRRCDSF